MPRKRVGAPRGSAAWKARDGDGVRRSWDVVRQAARILPADVRALRSRRGPFRPELVALAARASDEEMAFLEAVGGDRASPQRRALARDAARLGLLVEALLLRFAQTGDEELAGRLSTLMSARRAGLQALGLDEQRAELSLQEYLAQHAEQAQAAQERSNGSPPAQPPADREADVAPGREEGSP